VRFRYFPRNNGYYFVSIKQFGGRLPWSQIAGKLLGCKQCLTDTIFLVCTEQISEAIVCLFYFFLLAGNINITLVKTFFFMGPQTQVGQASSLPRLRNHVY
jgi:hypothetical protein